MKRAFDTAIELRDDGREVYGQIFPLNTPAHIRELDLNGDVDEYEEMFLPGCTVAMRQHATRARGGKPSWIRFTIDHSQSLDARLGYCTELAETDDGVYATFSLYPQNIDKVRSILTESHTGMSIEFTDHVPPIVDGTTRKRRQIDVSAVTATPMPVYATAGIVSLREDALLHGGTPNLDAVKAMLAELRPASAA